MIICCYVLVYVLLRLSSARMCGVRHCLLPCLLHESHPKVTFEKAGALMSQKSLSLYLYVPTMPIIAALSVV